MNLRSAHEASAAARSSDEAAERSAEIGARGEAVRAALEHYTTVVRARLASDASATPGAEASSLDEAERRLGQAVEALTMLGRERPTLPSVVVAPPPSSRAPTVEILEAPPPSTTQAMPVPVAPPPASDPAPVTRRRVVGYEPQPSSSPDEPEPRSRPYGGALDAEGVALRAEFDALDFDSLSDADFTSHATELAARARHRQERQLVVPSIDLETRIIRRLTALAHQRRLPRPIFGLSRSHQADWASLARRARDEREKRAASAAMRAARSAPESSPNRVPTPNSAMPAYARDDDDDAPLELPRLRARAKADALVVVGGVVKAEKLERLRKSTGIEVEWIGLDVGKSASTVAALAKRIRGGRLAALVLLNGLMDHKQSEPLMSAARDVGLPVVYADKAGKGALSRALLELDRRLGADGAPTSG